MAATVTSGFQIWRSDMGFGFDKPGILSQPAGGP
jgi:hypothetical protein